MGTDLLSSMAFFPTPPSAKRSEKFLPKFEQIAEVRSQKGFLVPLGGSGRLYKNPQLVTSSPFSPDFRVIFFQKAAPLWLRRIFEGPANPAHSFLPRETPSDWETVVALGIFFSYFRDF